MKNVICLLVDRLHIGYWGAYGNAEIETPTLDRLAAESFFADRFHVDTPDPVRQCRSWWCGVHTLSQNATPTIMAQLNAMRYRTVLVTDDPEVAYSPDAADFTDVQLLPTPNNTVPCDEIDATHLCGMLATIAATAESLARSGCQSRNLTIAKQPYFLWCHLRGFDAIWDFPLALREKYCGDGDPAPYSGVIPPYHQGRTQSAECKVQNAEIIKNDGCGIEAIGEVPISEEFDDFRQAAVSAYMGGVTMFDELLEMLIGPLRDGELGDETLFLLAGTRGVLFGEHGTIGIPPTDGGQVEPLASPLVQVPFALRFPDGFGATVRSDALLQPPDMTRLLYEWLDLPMPETLQNKASDSSAMLDLIREEPQNLRDRILVVAPHDEPTASHAPSCLVTPSWFLTELDPAKNPERPADAPLALYVKPDDRWDINNVADRCDEIVEQLLEVRTDLTRRLVANDTTPTEPLSGILRERLP
ncbi:MAG: sulfatase-like hydrolase/transferase [Planctomycetaceae bacterium]|nr:sulfatase-like hydrolase/transferase [Planctomycetaceae bacterium]